MVNSMTGFGVGEAQGDGHIVKVELKSVNHRFCEVRTKLPRIYNSFEEKVNRKIKEKFARGYFEVYIDYQEKGDMKKMVHVDKGLALAYYKSLEELAETLGIQNAAGTVDIARFPEVINVNDDTQDLEAIWLLTKIALYDAINGLKSMRIDEGLNLKRDILDRLGSIRTLAASIGAESRDNTAEYRNRLFERIAAIVDDVPLDEDRLALEVAIYAEKSDITEEIVRLNSHLDQLETILEEKDPVGRKLDFLVQEMNREVNTIGSKSNRTSISQKVVDVKSELEKIREQVQNIE